MVAGLESVFFFNLGNFKLIGCGVSGIADKAKTSFGEAKFKDRTNR